MKSADNIWYQMQVMPYRTSENVIEGTVITFVNITQEVALAEELKDYKEKYEHLLELTKTVVYTQNKDLKYTSIFNEQPNQEFKSYIGKTDKELFGKENALVLEAIKKKVIKTKSPSRDIVALKINNKIGYYDLTVRPVFENDTFIGIACTSIDLTELKEAEKEILQFKKEQNGC